MTAMYRTPARVMAEDPKQLVNEAKAEVRVRLLDDRLRFFSNILCVGEPSTDDASGVTGVRALKSLAPFADWFLRASVMAIILTLMGVKESFGFLFLIAIFLLSFSLPLAWTSIARSITEAFRYGKIRNRLPLASLCTSAVALFASWNALVWTYSKKTPSSFGEGSSELLIVGLALWAAVAMAALYRREWSTSHGPGSQHELNSTEAPQP